MLTQSLEKYLLQIYRRQETQGEVHVTNIACLLNVSKPSVSRAVRLLAGDGLIHHENYGPLVLTEAGRCRAIKLNEKQTTVQIFLTGVLGVKQDIAEKESRLLGYVISDVTAERIRQAVGWGVTS